MFKIGHQKTLSDILDSIDPYSDRVTKILWLEELIEWIKLPIHPSGSSPISTPQHIKATRIKFLLQVLERNPNWKSQLSLVIESILTDMSYMNLLVDSGLPKGTGFISELTSRLLKKILPFNEVSNDITDLVTKIFRQEEDADWFLSLDEIILNELYKICFTSEEKKRWFALRFRKSLKQSLVILSSQMESKVFATEIRGLLPHHDLEQSAFWHYRIKINQFTSTVLDFNTTPEDEIRIYLELLSLLPRCSNELESILNSLDENGLTVQIVFIIDSIESYLERSEKILNILTQHLRDQPESIHQWQLFLGSLIQDSLKSHYIRPFLKSNLHLISRAIVERSSQSGEHYITRNAKEYKEMVKAAFGGGVLTSATALIKILITKSGLAPFFEGLLSGFNYAISFIIIQHFHFTLATKQPAMTAPALTSKLKQTRNRNQIPEFLEEVANLIRSQFLAALVNVSAVIPTALLIQLIWALITKSRILTEAHALKTLSSLNPFSSLTILYAMETGFILFSSSILAGYFENWSTYHKLGPRLENFGLLKIILPDHKAKKLINWLMSNLSSISGSIFLGFLLGFTPIWGHFFGLPFDVRHVTLSAGNLAIAASSLTLEALPILSLMGAILGIIVIGILNFAVSFGLSLLVAVTSQNIKQAWFLEVVQSTFVAIRKNPRYFLFRSRQ
jgi:site-specific recombinase